MHLTIKYFRDIHMTSISPLELNMHYIVFSHFLLINCIKFIYLNFVAAYANHKIYLNSSKTCISATTEL